MVDFIIRWSLRNRAAVIALAAILLVWGAWTAVRMPVDVFPDLTAPTVTVITEAQGMAPTELEAQVTFPIEVAMNGSPGVRRVRSASAAGISVVWVEFERDQEPYLARQIVSEKLLLVSGDLPPQAQRPVLAPMSSIMGEILFLALGSDRHSPIEMRTFTDTVLRRSLLAVPGVAQVIVLGGDEKQYQVRLDPARLQAHEIALAEVADALAASNRTVSAGFMVERDAEHVVTGEGRVRTVDDIGAAVIRALDGVPVRVRDLGEVAIGAAPKRGVGSSNAKPAVIVGVQKQPGVNTLTLTDRLDEVIADVGRRMPEGMALTTNIFRQADFIDVAVRNVAHALRDGAILVVLIVFAFLVNLRATLITLAALPLSLVAALLVLHYAGATLNTMTLGGMAIAVGALVDDAVIDVENVFRRLRGNARRPPAERLPALEVVYRASAEIRSSIVFATMIIVLVFVPLFVLSGVEGRLLEPLGAAYVVALAASLLVALTVTPALCYQLLPGSRGARTGREPWMLERLKSGYARLLEKVLRRPATIVVPALLLLVLAVIGVFSVGRSFLPEFNEGTLVVSAVTLPGTSLDQSARLAGVVQQVLLAQPEVVVTACRTGRAELDEHVQGVEASEIDVSLRMRDRSKEEFLAALRKDLTLVPGTNVTIGQPISHRIDHMLSGVRANVAVKIFGDDLQRLRQLAEKARAGMAAVEGVVDLSIEQQQDVPLLRVLFDRDAIARHGLTVEALSRQLEAAYQGVVVSRVLEGRNAFDLVLKLDHGAPEESWGPRSFEVGDLPIDTPAGARVPLRSLARIVVDRGPNVIQRENAERRIVVMCNVAGRDLGSVVADVRRAVDPIVLAAPGHHVEYGGQFESAEAARKLLLLLSAGIVIAIGFLLHVALGSMRDAILVMTNLPLALIGGVAGIHFSGGTLSVASMIGFVALFGIATRNGIMLVQHIRHLQLAEGVREFGEAVRRGARERLAPILMTALATALGLVPLALGQGEPGSEIQSPMAIVILWGLLSSTVLNMFVVPALYLRLGRPVAPAPPVAA